MFSTINAESTLKFIFNQTAMASSFFKDMLDGSGGTPGSVGSGNASNLSLALHTGPIAVGDAQTVNEVSTGTWVGYTRINAARTTGVWTVTGNKVENAGTLAFPTPTTGSTDTVVSWLSIGSGVSNRVGFIAPLAIETPRPFIADDVLADRFYVPGHAYVANQAVMFLKVEGASLPSGGTIVAEGVVCYVKATNNVTDTFQVSAASGDGTALTYTTKGSGYVVALGVKTVGINDPFQFDTTNKINLWLR